MAIRLNYFFYNFIRCLNNCFFSSFKQQQSLLAEFDTMSVVYHVCLRVSNIDLTRANVIDALIAFLKTFGVTTKRINHAATLSEVIFFLSFYVFF